VQNPKSFKIRRLKVFLLKKKRRAGASVILKNLRDPAFPLYFLLRNLNWLQREKWWNALSERSRRVMAVVLIHQRISVFHDVKQWKTRRGKDTLLAKAPVSDTRPPDYCDKCGLCCEIASGMPDFPDCPGLPERWRTMFGNGLGRGHRFCPFLWEDGNSGGGLCSIYQWRSNPCRMFDSEECDFFRNSPEPAEISSGKNLLLVRRWLANLVYCRKLPLARADVTAVGPELLKFDRV